VEQRDALFAFTRDASTRVARRAGLALVHSRLDPASLDRLWECATQRPDRSLLPSFTSLDRWRQMLYAARGLRSGDPIARDFAGALLDHAMTTWNSSFTSPPAVVGNELLEVLPLALRRLDAQRVAVIRHSLRPFLPTL
jgi:hypothetical protein